MTRQEAIKLLNELYIRADITDEYGDMEDMQPYEEALEIVTKALEQESILDKIKVEIEEQVLERLLDNGDDWFTADKVDECLEIIDKYKAESEDKE